MIADLLLSIVCISILFIICTSIGANRRKQKHQGFLNCIKNFERDIEQAQSHGELVRIETDLNRYISGYKNHCSTRCLITEIYGVYAKLRKRKRQLQPKVFIAYR